MQQQGWQGCSVQRGASDGATGPPLATQVTVGEDEPEDIAVRKFMTKIMDSRLLEEVRGVGVAMQQKLATHGVVLAHPIAPATACCLQQARRVLQQQQAP